MQNKSYHPVQGHSRSLKVNENGINRKPVCDFLTDILSRPFRSYCSLLFKFWTLCVFEPPFGGLMGNVRCSS